MSIDTPQFNAEQVAALSGTEVSTVHTWTTRGLVDPYRSPVEIKRGRGVARAYSIRDVLRFYLMERLHRQFRTPLPQGVRICNVVFGENFNPDNPAFCVLELKHNVISATWCGGVDDIQARLLGNPLLTVIDRKRILGDVMACAQETQKTGDQ